MSSVLDRPSMRISCAPTTVTGLGPSTFTCGMREPVISTLSICSAVLTGCAAAGFFLGAATGCCAAPEDSSVEDTPELQRPTHLALRLLLLKKKTKADAHTMID